jgi:hypothetical protein
MGMSSVTECRGLFCPLHHPCCFAFFSNCRTLARDCTGKHKAQVRSVSYNGDGSRVAYGLLGPGSHWWVLTELRPGGQTDGAYCAC